MKVIFTKQRDFIYTLAVEIPYTNEEIITELKNEIWTPDQAGYGQNSFSTRFRDKQVQSSKLLEIEQWVEHGDFKSKIINQLYAEKMFSAYWGVTPERMMSMTHMYGGFTKDLPGYNIRIHTDDRMHVVQGMIYFINGDDPRQSTTAYTSKNQDNPLRIPTGHGIGYFASNTNDSWHTGQNASNVDRYSLIFGIRLDL